MWLRTRTTRAGPTTRCMTRGAACGRPAAGSTSGCPRCRARRCRSGSDRRRPRSTTSGSPSRSTATRRASRRSGRWTWCPASSTGTSGRGVERGLVQRIQALNLFVEDCYNDQRIIKDGVVPEDLLRSASAYREPCRGLHPTEGVWCHITGVDLVRARRRPVLRARGQPPLPLRRVLRAREPGGHEADLLPGLPGARRPARGGLLRAPALDAAGLRAAHGWSVRPRSCSRRASTTPPTTSTPSSRSRWAWSWSKGRDLVVKDGFVFMQTTDGLQRVDVIYRRIDDDFLDPECVSRGLPMLGVART